MLSAAVRVRSRAAALVLMLGCTPLTATEPALVKDLRLGEWDDRTRLVLEADRPIDAKLNRRGRVLHLFLPATNVATLRQAVGTTPPANHMLIQRHHLEGQADGSLALVLEFTADMEVEMFTLNPHDGKGHRVVLDLRPAARAGAGAPGDRPTVVPGQATTQPGGIAAGGDREPESTSISLHDLRLGQWPDRTRLVLETDRELVFRLMTPSPGRRVTLEFDGLAADILAASLAAQLPDHHALIQHADINSARPGHARLDLRLGRHSAINIFNLRPENDHGHRLVLDLLPQPELVRDQPPQLERKPDPAPEPERVLTALETEMLWLEARLNHQRGARVVLALRDADNRLLLGGKDLRQWRLRLPDTPDRHEHGEDWYALENLGIAHELDAGSLTLDLTAPAALFVGYAVDRPQQDYIEPTASGRGAFFNYDLSAIHANSRTTGGGLLELGAFNGWGSGTTTAVVRHGSADNQPAVVRLDSSWRRDNPERLRSLVVGDTTTGATAWSGGVRFGGIQYGRNFSTQPEFITLPMLSMTGEAALPSTIELYVNDALRLRRQVDPGQFSVDEIPAVTGSGEVRLVVRDVLGREQIISRSFFASQRLLQQGLHDWSWNVGFIRENHGIDSFDYGRFLASATHRYGINDRLTVEAHAQWLEDQGMAGIGAAWLLPGSGVVHAATAYSHADHGSGQLHIIGLQHQGKHFSAGIESQFADAGFTRLGMSPDRPLPTRQHRAHASTRLPGGSSLSLSYTEQDLRERDDVEFLTLRFSRRLGDFGFLSLTALHKLDDQETTLSASLSIPLGRRTSAGISASWREERPESTLHVQRSLPPGSGYGYRVQAGLGDNAQHQASLGWRHDYGTWQLETARSDGQSATRATVDGGFAMVDGNLFATRRISDSFAVVEVPGFANVRIYADNQEVARTNAGGNALVPRLRPYERNRLSIEQADLPLGTRIDGLEEIVAPYWRSGVFVSFPVARTRDAFFRILLQDGQPLPVGAAVEDEHGELWPVGHRGEVFMTDLLSSNLLRAYYNGQRCEFILEVPETDDPLPDLGSVTCLEIKP